jgi:hypothetical protein
MDVRGQKRDPPRRLVKKVPTVMMIHLAVSRISSSSSSSMALSRFAYVRDYELPDPLLQGTFIILRIDGHAFKKYPLIIIPLFYPSLSHPTDLPKPMGSRSPTTLAASRSWIMPPYLSWESTPTSSSVLDSLTSTGITLSPPT